MKDVSTGRCLEGRAAHPRVSPLKAPRCPDAVTYGDTIRRTRALLAVHLHVLHACKPFGTRDRSAGCNRAKGRWAVHLRGIDLLVLCRQEHAGDTDKLQLLPGHHLEAQEAVYVGDGQEQCVRHQLVLLQNHTIHVNSEQLTLTKRPQLLRSLQGAITVQQVTDYHAVRRVLCLYDAVSWSRSPAFYEHKTSADATYSASSDRRQSSN